MSAALLCLCVACLVPALAFMATPTQMKGGGGETFNRLTVPSPRSVPNTLFKAASATLVTLAAVSSSGGGASAAAPSAGSGDTNAVVRTVNGIAHKRLGAGDIIVSELGLGTQRWVSDDLNAPQESECFAILDEAILQNGISLIDTASQYPIPSSRSRPEGLCEETLGKWMAQDKSRRAKCVIATKMVGSSNVDKRNIQKDCEASLRRLQTDYIDVFLLHWPARYSPQSNWGQSLMYHRDVEKYYQNSASFADIVEGMGKLIKEGKIRGYGFCNDNCFGLTAAHYTAKAMGVPPPCCLQNDFSLINRRIEENGVSEASSPIHCNTGFMAYNVLAGGQLTGKYLDAAGQPKKSVFNLFSKRNSQWTDPKMEEEFRGRFDLSGWGQTLYRYQSGPAVEATRAYDTIAKKYKISLTEMALRFARGRESVTTSLLGNSNLGQFQQDLSFYKNKEPLPVGMLMEIDRVHMRNRLPIFSSTGPYGEYGDEGLIGERIP